MNQSNCEGEIEVFRLTPEKEKFYLYAEATRKVGTNQTGIKYYTTNKLKYVGQYIRDYRTNTGDGGYFWAIFKDGDVENRVDYSYAGNTCFIQVEKEETSV
jgi:hypothetical protein